LFTHCLTLVRRSARNCQFHADGDAPDRNVRDPALAAEAKSRERGQSEATSHEPWPLESWPEVPTHVIIGRDDRFFTAEWLREVVRDRLGIDPDELPTGHTPALSRPRELVELMESYRT
jgi:pimeloyl-ACP methyl ester carboxylesterase